MTFPSDLDLLMGVAYALALRRQHQLVTVLRRDADPLDSQPFHASPSYRNRVGTSSIRSRLACRPIAERRRQAAVLAEQQRDRNSMSTPCDEFEDATEALLDKMSKDSFPASDPPSTDPAPADDSFSEPAA